MTHYETMAAWNLDWGAGAAAKEICENLAKGFEPHAGRGLGIELSPRYWADAVYYCEAAEKEIATPCLFDLAEREEVRAR